MTFARKKINDSNARARKNFDLETDRLLRKLDGKCVCGHGPRVHTEEGCQMDQCSCEVASVA